MPKPDGERQRRNRAPVLELGPAIERKRVPPVPEHLLTKTREEWRKFWRSDASAHLNPENVTDLQAVSRLFTLEDERERAYRGYRMERMVKGSRGQKAMNPLGRQMVAFEREIRLIREDLGLTARTKPRGPVGLDDLNRALSVDDADDPRR